MEHKRLCALKENQHKLTTQTERKHGGIISASNGSKKGPQAQFVNKDIETNAEEEVANRVPKEDNLLVDSVGQGGAHILHSGGLPAHTLCADDSDHALSNEHLDREVHKLQDLSLSPLHLSESSEASAMHALQGVLQMAACDLTTSSASDAEEKVKEHAYLPSPAERQHSSTLTTKNNTGLFVQGIQLAQTKRMGGRRGTVHLVIPHPQPKEPTVQNYSVRTTNHCP